MLYKIFGIEHKLCLKHGSIMCVYSLFQQITLLRSKKKLLSSLYYHERFKKKRKIRSDKKG